MKPLQIKGVKLALVSFLFYCGVESTMGLWGSSYLVNVKGLSVAVAAQWVSLYYAGITVGRLITGFITMKVSNRILIRSGQITALMGAAFLLLPLPTNFSLVGFILVGLGLAPIFPCMFHETPAVWERTFSVHYGLSNGRCLYREYFFATNSWDDCIVFYNGDSSFFNCGLYNHYASWFGKSKYFNEIAFI